jgi:hypothetical protein
MATVCVFHAGKDTVQFSKVETAVDNILLMRTQDTVLTE